MPKRFLFYLFLFYSASFCFSQTESDMKLALYYYENSEYDKALIYYKKIYEGDQSKIIYTRYFDCLIQLKDYKAAEKTIKKQISLSPKDLPLQLELGFFYELIDEAGKAKKVFEEAMKIAEKNPARASEVFHVFLNKSKLDLAKETLDKSEKNTPDYPFQLLYAELYQKTGEKKKMFDAYFDLLDKYPEYKEAVQLTLSSSFDFTENNADFSMLKSAFLAKIQKPTSNLVFTEMLIWLFIESKNFASAFVQVVALDKQFQSFGGKVMEFGKICVENESFEVARKCFNYVISIGPASPYYNESENALLNTRYIEITQYSIYSKDELESALKEYRSVIDKNANPRKSINIILEYTKIMAFYAGNKTDAIEFLEQFINTVGLSSLQQASVKMLLADIYVLSARIWDASILYMQIDNDFKFDVIGNEAKYKNARVFYFDGEFDYAQSQLNVLKESTSKLIANDAMQLSVAITDNFGLDSNYQAMIWFATAELFIEQNQIDSAFRLFDSIQVNYPFHSLNDELLFKKGQAMEREKKWNQAIAFYEKIAAKYSMDILADDAVFRLAKINELFMKDKEKALSYYKEILFKYPGSLYSDESRKKVRELRGDKVISDEE